jgi:molybdate transport system substrate-binding protein
MRRRAFGLAVACTLLATACDGSTASSTGTTTTLAASRLSGTLRVFAASSLTEAFTALGRTFERQHPGLRVVGNATFAASSMLSKQIYDGAPADVFASADEANMAEVTSTGKARAPVTFARNRLELMVGAGNPKQIRGLADLDRTGLKFSVCAPEVPCGTLAAAALERAGIRAAPVSQEANVKAVVSRVTLGEVDAGIVYETDVKGAGEKAAGVPIEIAASPDLEAVYQLAVTAGAPNRRAATAWVAFVRSPAGQRVLATYGFRTP